MSVAFNFPASSPTATQVSDPNPHQETYDGQQVIFGYNQAASQVIDQVHGHHGE